MSEEAKKPKEEVKPAEQEKKQVKPKEEAKAVEQEKKQEKPKEEAKPAKEEKPKEETAPATEEKPKKETKPAPKEEPPKKEDEKPKEKAKQEKATACIKCGKTLSKKSWYYRNSKYYCGKRCWKTEKSELKSQEKEKAKK